MQGYRLNALALTLVAGSAGAIIHGEASSRDAAALAPIVGEWQSDTVGGVSAHSTCAWTARHAAVVCEQQLERIGAGTSNVLDVFAADSTGGTFSLYVLSPPEDATTRVPLSIHGSEWVYGGSAPSRDGRYYRTINDFSQTASYTWRQESSLDGKEWTSGMHGSSRRIR